MARVYIVSSSLFVKGRLFAAARLEEERDGKVIRSMPVIANLVADLTAAGWPKGKAHAKKTTA